MTSQQKLFYWIGMIIAIILLGSVLWFIIWGLYEAIADRIDSHRDERNRKAYGEACISMGDRILDAADWFSMEPEIYNTLKLLGRGLMDNKYIDPGKIRTEVRAAGKKKLNS